MSRSKNNKSGKGPGYDYWSNRPGNNGCIGPGKYGGKKIKKRTHRLERLEKKKDLREFSKGDENE